MKLYGLLGYPLGHSFSAKYFAEKFYIDNRIKKWEFVNRDKVNVKEIETLKQKYSEIEK